MYELMFGHTLRMLRTTAGLSLRSLAKKIDVSPAYLSQVELGKLKPPTHDRINKIAETIGVPEDLLIEMSHRPNPDTILLLRGHQELNEFIRLTYDIGLESRDIFEIISLMRKLGGSGFRKLIHYGGEHSADFTNAGRGELSSEVQSSPINHMSLSNLVNPRLVFKRLEFTEKSDLLRYMIEKIGMIYNSFDLDRAYKKLMSNEAEDSSGLGNGVALPHLFVDELDQTIIAVARIPEGIDFRAIDKKAVFFVCLILSNPESCQSHLNLLAYFARKFQIPTFVDEILKAGSKKNVLSMLSGGDNTSMH
ncbi:MAG: helix-turn-helix domain-containing protein [Candidatus Aminicenantes bacterium]|nr:helix-turn-helix domain-containing protein [Candidatus Aminicenantes bacterium]